MSNQVKLEEIINYFETWAPEKSAAHWDNTGLQIKSPKLNIKNVLAALDINNNVIDLLNRVSYDLVITHHPLFFRPVKKIDCSRDTGRVIDLFVKKNINLYSAHTNLDLAPGGVNDCLIKSYGLKADEGQAFYENPGKWYINENKYDLNYFISKNGGQIRGCKQNKEIKRIAFCCGSGRSLVNDLIDYEIDLYITGELNYHDYIFCELNSISVLELGHKESEVFILPEIQSRLKTRFSNLKTDVLKE